MSVTRSQIALAVSGLLFVVATSQAATDSRFTDKRLSRSMELYRLETGMDSPEVKSVLAQKDSELLLKNAELSQKDSDLKAAKEAIAAAQEAIDAANGALAAAEEKEPGGADKNSEKDPLGDVVDEQQAAEEEKRLIKRAYILKQGPLDEALAEILKTPDVPGEPEYRLVWRAPQYIVAYEFKVEATDTLDLLEKVLQSYNREGIALEAVLFAGNNVIEVGLGGWRQRKKLPTIEP